MGLKKVSLGKKEVHLSTETEHWLFKRIGEEQNQNEDLKRTINDLRTQIDHQQDLLRYLAGTLAGRPTNKVTSTTMIDVTPSGNESSDEEIPLTVQEAEAEAEKYLKKKRKLSASPDQSNQDENKQ